ncbi:S41 family peptidase [Natranaerobius trueperi]|uniref:Peptidase S41 n=1 Tax=Natranaerobius trueperi TaxID=759412 RepID=A0A226BXJ5_9FIRM|nr:S41 family peptidase [Natranaerobius trueperi]OWZ83716.1 peptidase S41 [Natranaerobius trueperi]
MRIKKILIVFLVLIVTNVLTFMGAHALGENDTYYPSSPDFEIGNEASADFKLLEEVLQTIENNYLEEVDREELLDGALEGMLEVLDDPQTGYLTQDEFQNLMIQTEGSYGGIGIEVFKEDDYVTVVAPIAGTPGAKEGLRSGDRIISVDGEEIVGKDLDEAVDRMRGPIGSNVKIEIDRPGMEETLEFEIERKEIEIDSVEYEMVDDSVGYLKITNFSQTTGDEFEKALTDLQKSGMEGLVLDLRDNPGGVLTAAIEVSEQIVPEGPIVHQVGRDGKMETDYSQGEDPDFPIVVLVNEVSASASEILAGALQDTETATLVGSTTFGKASVQNVEPLAHGGALRYTMAKYQTPDGREIDEKGLTPDVKVDPPAIIELTRKPISTDLGIGDEGEKVKTLQEILTELGYFDDEISGYFGENTKVALEAFQQSRNIEVTGEMNEMVIREFYEEIEDLLEKQDDKLEKGIEILEKEVD